MQNHASECKRMQTNAINGNGKGNVNVNEKGNVNVNVNVNKSACALKSDKRIFVYFVEYE